MPNSTITLQNIVDDANTLAELAPVLANSGMSDAPALSIANDVISAMLLGGPDGQVFNWKFNRLNLPTFPTNSYQQDYFLLNVSNLGWLENALRIDINSTSVPKPDFPIEVKRDLDLTFQVAMPAKISWIPNDLCITGTWGVSPLGPTATNPQGQLQSITSNYTGMLNPGPNVVYTNPIGAVSQPLNATTIIKDPNGNFWLLTQYGVCGAVQPTWPSTPSYPTYQKPNQTPTVVTDGTVVWTAINPKGQGVRLSHNAPQSGNVWLIQPIGQMRVPVFTSLSQTLEPIPDDYATYFKQGFFAQCFRRSADIKVRSKFRDEWALFLQGLDKAVRQSSREPDDYGFVPSSSIMETGFGYQQSPATPFGPFR
jgi:hypothetical protein